MIGATNWHADGIWRLLEPLGAGPVFVHSDLRQTASLVPARAGREETLAAHMDLLRLSARGRSIWMPAFNYDFPKRREFNVCSTRSQVGSLSEHFRTRFAHWRSIVPIFSFSGEGESPNDLMKTEMDPFGELSGFADLVRRDSVILFYGAPLSSATILHYAESVSGGPLYRYDKCFPGTVVLSDGSRREVSLLFHVRPFGKPMDYNWTHLHNEFLKQGILHSGDGPLHTVTAISARGIVETLVSLLKRDPFGLLDQASRGWVESLTNHLGRRVRIDDFELEEVDDC